MTRDAATQAVHERLEHAVSAMPTFDVEAGWAALAAQLDGPIAPVIPLRRRHPRRVVALAVAAAVFIGGGALAMVRHGDAPGLSIVPIATLPASGSVTGPHVHPAFSGATVGPDGTNGGDPGGPKAEQPSGSHSTGGGSSQGGSGGSGDPNKDARDDIDHGSGNDGQHDDNGRGNDAQGPQPGKTQSGGHGSDGSNNGH